jgi:ABC-2 type transport system ATP-binding protein
MLEARLLTKRYGEVVALDALDLAIAPGEIYCLLGANGAGKSTTIKLFLDFLPRTSGQALIGGLDVAEAPLETKRLTSYVPEIVNLYPTLTGLENVEFFARLAGVQDLSRAHLVACLAKAGVPGAAVDRRVGGYSKGMRQKVGLAIAVAKRAKVLILDEPLSGLDPQAANEFGALLREFAGEGAAVLMATHDLFRAREVGSRIGIMKHGRLVDSFAAERFAHADLERLYLDHMRT